MVSQTRTAVLQSILLVVALSFVAVPAVAQGAGQSMVADERVGAGAGTESLAGETVNLRVTAADGAERTFSFEVTEDERIEDLERGPREDATMGMHTDGATFQRIAHAPNPERKFQTAVERGAVETRSADASDAADASDEADDDVFDDVAELARSLGLS